MMGRVLKREFLRVLEFGLGRMLSLMTSGHLNERNKVYQRHISCMNLKK